MRTSTRAHTSSSWEETLNISTGDKSERVKEKKKNRNITFVHTVHVRELNNGEILILSLTWIFTIIQTEAEGLGEGHTHRLPQRGPQERGQA